MKNNKSIISNQISADQINQCCNDDLKHFMGHFFQLEFNWLRNAYTTFKDFEKYIILIYLINMTLKTYNKHFYNISFDDFYKSNSIEIEKISVMELVKKLSITKETARRKLNELSKTQIISRNRKKIVLLNPFKFQKPEGNIKELAKLLKCISMKLKKNYGLDDYEEEEFIKLIKKNYTHYWHHFLNFQLDFIVRRRKEFGSIDNLYIVGVCTLNQSFNIKNTIEENYNSVDEINFAEFFTSHPDNKLRGLNPTTISDLTGMPRASVIRKLKILTEKKILMNNKKNLFSLATNKKNPSFKKMKKLFLDNQAALRIFLKDMMNFIRA